MHRILAVHRAEGCKTKNLIPLKNRPFSWHRMSRNLLGRLLAAERRQILAHGVSRGTVLAHYASPVRGDRA